MKFLILTLTLTSIFLAGLATVVHANPGIIIEHNELILTCAHGSPNDGINNSVEVKIFNRLSSLNEPLRNHAGQMYKVEVSQNGVKVYEARRALFNENNQTYSANSDFILDLKEQSLYLSAHDGNGVPYGPIFNTLSLSCVRAPIAP